MSTINKQEFERFCDEYIDGTDNISREWLFDFCNAYATANQRNAAGVLVKNLEGLQTQWTAKAPSPTNDYRGGLHDAYELCSKDLAELIAEYKA